jgi:hypothetical protein
MCKPSPVLTIFSQPVPKTRPGSEEFGNDQHPKDLLQNGVLQVAPGGQAACGAFRNLLVLSRVTTVYWEEPWPPGGFDEHCSFEIWWGTHVLSGKNKGT